jgi:hypothetical protein
VREASSTKKSRGYREKNLRTTLRKPQKQRKMPPRRKRSIRIRRRKRRQTEWLDPEFRRFARKLAAQLTRRKVQQPGSADNINPSLIDPAIREKLPAVNTNDPDFATWVAAYDRWGDRLFGGLPRYCGPASIQALVDTGQVDNATLTMMIAKIEADVGSAEDFSPDKATEARLSGPDALGGSRVTSGWSQTRENRRGGAGRLQDTFHHPQRVN